jgi:hypothetical protein
MKLKMQQALSDKFEVCKCVVCVCILTFYILKADNDAAFKAIDAASRQRSLSSIGLFVCFKKRSD